MNEIPKIIESKEKILWAGGPKFSRYMVSHILISILILLVFVPYGILIFNSSALGAVFVSGLALVFVGIFLLHGYLSYKSTYYGITDKRIIFQTGIIGRDFITLDFDKIANVNVDIGLFDRILGTGSVEIYSAKVGGEVGPFPLFGAFQYVTTPYDVTKKLQETLSGSKQSSEDVLKQIESALQKRTK